MMMGTLLAMSAYATSPQKASGEAVLAAAVKEPKDVAIKGVTWRCDTDKCVIVAGDWSGVDSFMKRCSAVATAVGPLVSFRSGGRSADKSDIATCNRLAKV
jgi:hypothetical protein